MNLSNLIIAFDPYNKPHKIIMRAQLTQKLCAVCAHWSGAGISSTLSYIGLKSYPAVYGYYSFMQAYQDLKTQNKTVTRSCFAPLLHKAILIMK